MSVHSIKKYQAEVKKLIHFGGSSKETSIRNAFYVLLNEYARQKDLILVPEVTVRTKKGKNVIPDGTLKDVLRQDWGYWESKDEADNLDEEIEKKFAKGYPKENILFEDSQTAVLIQNGFEVMRVPMKDAEGLDRLLKAFVYFERSEVQDFRKAIELFKEDIPKVTKTIREIIITQGKENLIFVKARDAFLELCRESINPDIVVEDIREMMIQHILTADIFNTIFDEPHFHRENNIARELENIVLTFFTGETRRSALSAIQHYYQAINAAAACIPDHHEKQKFLKVLYETFYKSYNPKAADRLGVVYTPNEIVKFMIQSTDYLLYKHFGNFLEDEVVEILDPAAGTGTFICDIIDFIENKEKLEYKYKNEIHANEVAILPYYIANLNIEFTYKQKTGDYKEFENLCFVDTLDNMGFDYKDKQFSLFGLSAENLDRIKRQNERKISVIIGNPPYNANQKNENENNKNREYPEIDKRIKNSFVKYSKAQKTKVYDMYARFYRWSFDRLNNNGIIAFITNRSFIDSRTFDGFRKCIQYDFDYCYIIDTKSDVRANPKIAGTTHNVFGIQTGVAVMFLVKHTPNENRQCQIRYIAMDDFWRKEEKLQWFIENSFKDIQFEHLIPDKFYNWINLVENDFSELLAIDEIFRLLSPGVNTARDEWVFDHDIRNLNNKCRYFINTYNALVRKSDDSFPDLIKWSASLKSSYNNGTELTYKINLIREYLYRPFNILHYYAEKLMSDRLTSKHFSTFGTELESNNYVIAFSGVGSSKPFGTLASKYLISFDLLEKTQYFSLYIHRNNKRISNITKFGLDKFKNFYKDSKISGEDIFHYIYAVFHNPNYRRKYKFNLRREFPRIPFYKDFYRWRDWGKKLMGLHINFEMVEPYCLREQSLSSIENPKTKLKADKESGTIILDEATTLSNIPKIAWEYKLGNRSALEWVLDQYRQKKPRDNIIAEKFNNYKFTDYKQNVINLLKQVCTVSVEAMKTISEMEKLKDS